ncbi:hypothetical protein J1N35_016751 [Gossypium stocksii]|uniref:Uncharacterized protein n=1 Tax=Gossypium stocksii TaxID=47602 RepID=A0A9D3VL60_9ROSI|nr:hypothetical protein J1N35_016751 [Gossypium stocksii]
MDSRSSNSQPRGWVTHGSKKKSSYANVVTSSRKECAYDGPAWYDGKMCDRATELLRQLCDSERNHLKDNLALRKNAMVLVAFDGNHNSGSSDVDIEVEGGRSICGVEGEVALRKKILTMKQKIKVIKKEKSMYRYW